MSPYPGVPDSIPELIASYEQGPNDLANAVAGLSAEQLRARPIAGKWSTIEVLAHLCDSEQVIADRLKRTIAMERPLLMAYDESLYAKHLGYQNRDAAEELAVIRQTRAQVTRILRALPSDAWERVAVHSERGIVPLKIGVQTAIGHLVHHMPFIVAKRKALGL